MRVVFGTVLVEETASRFRFRFILTRPVHRLRRPVHLYTTRHAIILLFITR